MKELKWSMCITGMFILSSCGASRATRVSDVSTQSVAEAPGEPAQSSVSRASDEAVIASKTTGEAAHEEESADGGDVVSSPFGTSSESVSSDAVHALDNLDEDGDGEARGFGGLGIMQDGQGGGVSERSIGQESQAKPARVPKVVPGRPEVEGSLDKEIIRRVVRLHRNEIRYCY